MKWPTSVILTCYTGNLLCDIDKLYKFLNWMTKDNLYTHQLGRAADVCRPFLEKQIPWLTTQNRAEINADNWKTYLSTQIQEHGRTIDVSPLPAGTWQHIAPATELLEMMNKTEENNNANSR